ncbi:MAG: ribosomal protein S18-alanine N-acetyltransferase [Anaerovoracaceae bacterium]|jgi:ribosomal-protein-alanine N-acetyltransferase
MNSIIRFAKEQDIEAMAELDCLCFSVPWSKESFRQEIMENELALYLVAEEQGRIVGYAGLWMVCDEGHITNVAVKPECQRRGLGKLLVSKLIEIAEKQGINGFTLEVRVSNYGAISLYKNLGFVPLGKRIRYYEDNNEDALIMWRFQINIKE